MREEPRWTPLNSIHSPAQLTAPSRRGILARLASGVLACLPLVLGGEEVEGKKKRKKKRR
jgi:hypothetical protein